MELPNDALVNFIYHNEAEILWPLTIVLYPYMTGIIAGAFVVSSLYHVFKLEAFKSIARFSLVFSFCFGVFAALPLLFHIAQPLRAFNIYTTPHWTAAMSVFGYIYGAYMLLLTIEIWLVYRPFFVEKANQSNHLIWRILTLDITTVTPESLALDRKLVRFLAGLGIPIAFVLHGYVGFIFGSIKAVAWWATPLQPVIFLSSAVVSGIAMILLVHSFLTWRRKQPFDFPMLKTLATCLWIAFILAFSLELLDVGYAFFEQGRHWALIQPLLAGPLFNSYVVWQIAIFSLVPLVILGFVVLGKMRDHTLLLLANLASFLLLLQVLFMRFNVVIGGQLISRSDRGFAEFHFEFLGKEGVFMTVILFTLPFVLYGVLSRFIPILGDKKPAEQPA